MDFNKFSAEIFNLKERSPSANKSSARIFLEFCAARFGEGFCTNKLGLWEFSEYAQILDLTYSENSVYNLSTSARLYCRQLENRSCQFKTSPINWKCPPKPDIDHFDPLSRSEYNKLCRYLDDSINTIRERLHLTVKAGKHKSKAETSGSAFISRQKSFFMHQITLMDALSSLIKYFPDFPIEAKKEALLEGGAYGMNKRNVEYELLNNEVKIYRKRFSVQRIKAAKPALSDYPELGFQNVMDIILPDAEEAAAIRKAICLETGWSPDLVARIDPNDFTFQDIDPNSDYIFLKTLKVKGTQRDENFTEAKSIFAPSSKTKENSAYNLIKLWITRTEPLRQTKAYASLIEELGFEPFFVVVNSIGSISKRGALRALHPETKKRTNNSRTNNLAKETLGFKLDERQLRPTHLFFRAKDQNIPFALLVVLFGHSDSAITDEFYQSGSHFEQDRKDRLGKALTKIDESLVDGSFAGQLIPLKEKKTIEDKVYSIFSDHSNQNPIAICSNPLDPTWPGFKHRIRPGTACKAFNKCLLCTKSQVFSDNLPFVVDRYLYLEKQRRSLRDDQFLMFLDEYNASKNVVDSWPYQEEVEEAKERTFTEGYLLPPILLGDSF